MCLRYFNAAGADPEGWIGRRARSGNPPDSLARSAPSKRGSRSTVFGDDYPTPDGTCIRDYIHVNDLAQAHILALGVLTEGCRREVQRGHGNGQQGPRGAAGRGGGHGTKVPYTIGPRRPGDQPALVANSEKLRRTLGWKPEYVDLKRTVATAWNYAEKRMAGVRR